MYGSLDCPGMLAVWMSLACLPSALLAHPDGVQHLIALLDLSPHKLTPIQYHHLNFLSALLIGYLWMLCKGLWPCQFALSIWHSSQCPPRHATPRHARPSLHTPSVLSSMSPSSSSCFRGLFFSHCRCFAFFVPFFPSSRVLQRTGERQSSNRDSLRCV